MPLLHQLDHLALAHDGVGQVEPGKLDLLRAADAQRLLEPVVEAAVVLELQGADGVGDALDGVALAVGPVVGGVDVPGVARARVGGVEDAVHDRVAQDDEGRGHVNPGPQHAGAFGELPGAHTAEEVEVLLDAAVAVGAGAARLGQRAAIFADLVGAQVVHVGFAVADKLLGPVVELLEVVAGVKEAAVPLRPQPGGVFHDGVNVLLLLLLRVGVVEAQVEQAVVVLGQAVVEVDGFGVADVEVAIRLRREAGVDLPGVLAAGVVLVNDRPNEIRRGWCSYVCHGLFLNHRLHRFHRLRGLIRRLGRLGRFQNQISSF